MTTLTDRPAPTLLDRPLRCDETDTDNQDDYLFYEGQSIVYRLSADCFICAWKDGHPRWPNATLAVVCPMEPADLKRQCQCSPNDGSWLYIFYEGDVIVGQLNSYCSLTAWREGQSRWPLAELAGRIRMRPSDVSRRCLRADD